jgi:hypothetical protein
VRDARRSSFVRPRAAALALGAALALTAAALGPAGIALATTPSPGGSPPAATSAPEGGDARSPGEGAGLAGAPLLAIGAVAVIGAASAIGTLAFVRLTGGPGERPR